MARVVKEMAESSDAVRVCEAAEVPGAVPEVAKSPVSAGDVAENPIPVGKVVKSPVRAAAVMVSENHIPRVISKRTRHVALPVQRAVWERDQKICQHIGPEGRVCGETHFLEIDHLKPFAVGG